MTTFDKRIGRINELEDRVDWPETDLMGNSYERPSPMHMLSAVTFVILPRVVNPTVVKKLEELKRSDSVHPILEATSETVESKSKKG